MAFAGGAADKVGNEYELWWTLRRMVQLLRGEIQSMAVEPLGADGAELWVEVHGSRTFDQVKFRSSGQWTPKRLNAEGVLAKLRRHYAGGSDVLLLFNQPSTELERNIDLARATSSGAELWELGDNEALELFADAWGADKDETRSYLTQTHVRHDGPAGLREYVELAADILISRGHTLAIAALRNFLESRRSTTFTAPMVWAALKSEGLEPRPGLETGPTIARLRSSLERHVRSVQRSTPSGGVIRRQVVEDTVRAVTDGASSFVIVAGKAGSGKSVVIAEVAERLAASGRHVAVLRLDRINPMASNAEQLGESLELGVSPVVALSEVSAKGFDGVLIIDQLDAVSSYSGRMPDVYDAVDDALNQSRLFGNVRVVLSARSVDLAEDPRLRKLAGDKSTTLTVGELEVEEVRSFLTRIGTNAYSVDPTTLELLRLPIHLYVFGELEAQERDASFRTLATLFDAFTRTFRKRLDLAGYIDDWTGVSSALIKRMNSEQALAVPISTLEQFPPGYVDALVSANVLVQDEGRVSLFHETFFDYLFAKSFRERGNELVGWFANTGQSLFRRSQLRQLLAFIAADERDRFIEQVLAIADSDLRPHLVSIAYSGLADVTPTPSDWDAISRLVRIDNPFAGRVVSLLGSPSWFAAADSVGGVELLLADPAWNEDVSRLIARLAGDIPERVLELLSPHLSDGEFWVRALRTAADIADSATWGDFVLEHAIAGDLDLPNQPFDVLETSLFHALVETDPNRALRILAATLGHEVESGIKAGAALQDVLSRRGHRSADAREIGGLAMRVGPEFVDTLLPIVEGIATYQPPGGGSQVWLYRTKSVHRDFADDLYFAFDDALRELSRADFARAAPILERLTKHANGALDFLVCRAMTEAPPDRAVDWILESQGHREVGWISDFRWESRRLVETASRECSSDRFEALEEAFLFLNEPTEDPNYWLLRNGLSELEMLSALPRNRLSCVATRRLDELQRKFPLWVAEEPTGISGGFVRPPIDRQAAERMTDANWLRAIEKYNSPESPSFRDGDAFGGLHELASLLGALAKADPDRFIELAMNIPPSAPPAYSEHILRNVAGEVDQSTLLPLVEKFRLDHPLDSGRAVASAIDAYANELGDGLFEQLLKLANDLDPVEELARKPANGSFYFNGDFVSAGINSTRGLAASTLSRVLFANHDRARASIPALESLANDPIVAVRSLAVEAVLAFASFARSDGLDLLEGLLSNDLLLTTEPALRSLRWAMLWDAPRFAPLLSRALNSDNAKGAGTVWANCAVNDALGSVTSDVTALPQGGRLGVAEALSPVPALGRQLLTILFDDPSPDVRQQAARAVHFLADMDVASMSALVSDLMHSKAFEESTYELLHALEQLPGALPDATWELCRVVVRDVSNQTAGTRARGRLAVEGNLVGLLVRLYRAADGPGREAALDLIDETVRLQLWRVDEVLDEAR
ncbi:nSTAND1 domain-containing NTPase [Leifsonia sp. 22587]|uniref:nSTAND1 domain-containing NTPase n=1 Tax=Leifsonia sp. 22587 TaxID=3453946 RepID=UPI003F824574